MKNGLCFSAILVSLLSSVSLLFLSACLNIDASNQAKNINSITVTTLPFTTPQNEIIFAKVRFAIEKNNYSELSELLKSNPNLDIRNSDNESLLAFAMSRDLKSFKILLDANADPRFESIVIGCGEVEYCLKPLTYIAFMADNLKALDILLKYKADPNAESLLAWAVSRSNREAVKLLISYKADVNFSKDVGQAGQSPLFFSQETEIAELLLKNGADLNHSDENGQTALMIAVQDDNLKMAKFFIKKKSNLNLTNKLGLTVLQIAIKQGNKSIINELTKQLN
jgi:ankyrin repeat protein